MQYLFFDIECANCFNGHGKICSFGYVICDENFKVLEQRDILINPKSKFHLGKPGTDIGIKLAYEESEFLKHGDFSETYDEIKSLLTNGNYIAFGHAVGNDLQFILSDCERYKKEKFYVKAYDTQIIFRQLRKEKTDAGLERLCEEYGIEKEALHRSDYDALITMQVLKNICKETNCTIDELLAMFPESFLEIKHGEIVKHFNITSPAKTVLNYSKKVYPDKTVIVKSLEQVSIAIDNVFEESDIKRAKKIVRWIKRVGANYTIKTKKCNIYVMEDKDSKRSKQAIELLAQKKAEFKIMNLEELQKITNLEEEL